MLIMPFGCLRFLRESCLLYAFLLGYLPSIFLRFFYGNLLTFICRTPIEKAPTKVSAQIKYSVMRTSANCRLLHLFSEW